MNVYDRLIELPFYSYHYGTMLQETRLSPQALVMVTRIRLRSTHLFAGPFVLRRLQKGFGHREPHGCSAN